MTANERAAAETLITDMGKMCPRFIYREVTKWTYSQGLYNKTAYYQGIQGFQNWMYGDQDSSWFTDVQLYDVYKITEKDFTGSIKYQFMLEWKTSTRNFPGDNTLTFVKINGKWLLTHQQNHPVDGGEIVTE